ncbi:hypothetical protein CDAR_222761 [Caerostris darwini]|uniref:Uncharacterized protein n=1 Tax=Caerostris darwini TaxID=1538125 RepID=A0AAV4NIV2_9ARAC|nr:hypothetical protein CDAR_222761 [Caerostris darwini]
MAKFAAALALIALVGVCSGASFGGVKDLAGNYFDFSTGQYSSSLTGKVYNTAPLAYVPPVAPIAPVPIAPVAPVAVAPARAIVAPVAPYYYGAAAAPLTYVAPLWKK